VWRGGTCEKTRARGRKSEGNEPGVSLGSDSKAGRPAGPGKWGQPGVKKSVSAVEKDGERLEQGHWPEDH